jgi:hypothetical protein
MLQTSRTRKKQVHDSERNPGFSLRFDSIVVVRYDLQSRLLRLFYDLNRWSKEIYLWLVMNDYILSSNPSLSTGAGDKVRTENGFRANRQNETQINREIAYWYASLRILFAATRTSFFTNHMTWNRMNRLASKTWR